MTLSPLLFPALRMMSDRGNATAGDAPLPRWARPVLTLWLLIHLTAIVVAPSSVAPSSQLVQRLWLVFRPYLQGLYLNHGYHFFAPEPGESTLLAYTIERANGETIEGHIPHRGIWPRLLYHRHFMLTEQMPFVPPQIDADEQERVARPDQRDGRGERRATSGRALRTSGRATPDAPPVEVGEPSSPARPPLIENWYRSYARCLLRKHNGSQVTLRRVVHYLPTPEMVLDGVTLDNPPSFEEQPLGTYRREDL